MFCRICGHKLNDNAKFCPKCGTKVSYIRHDDNLPELEESSKEQDSEHSSSTSEENNEDSLKETVTEPSTETNAPLKEKKKRKKKKAVPVVIILLIAILGGYVYAASNYHLGIWMPNNNDDDEHEVAITAEGSDNTVYELKTENIKTDSDTGIQYVDNIIIVSFRSDVDEADINRIANLVDGTIVGGFPRLKRYQIQVKAQSLEELNTLCEIIEKELVVRDAHIDLAFEFSEDRLPADPWEDSNIFFGAGWNEDSPDGNNWWQEAINAPSAWEYKDFYKTINVGIIDNGFDTEHEDLKGVIRSVNSENVGQNHGSHVAGIIGAKDNNGIGITGVVWDANIYANDCTRMSTKTNEDGTVEENDLFLSDEHIFEQIFDLIECQDCKVINLSLGKCSGLDFTTLSDDWIYNEGDIASGMVCDLLDNGFDCIFVQSAGNGNIRELPDGTKEVVPVDSLYNGLFCSIKEDNCQSTDKTSKEDVMNRIIVVGAAQNQYDGNYSCASFSNYGEHVDIWAPGYEIYSTVPGGYAAMNGTSMAAPIVTGVTTLVWEADNSLSGDQVKAIVCDNDNKKYIVSGPAERDFYTLDHYGMVNAQLAVEKAFQDQIDNVGKEPGEDLFASEKEKTAKPLKYKGVVLTPEDVVMKMFSSLKEGEYEKAVECLQPEVEQKINFLGGLVANVIDLFAGSGLSWGQMLFEVAGATDVEIIECESYNLSIDSDIPAFSTMIGQLRAVQRLFYTDADVYVKYRYKSGEEYYIDEDTLHVKRYGTSGWRIEVE